MIYQYRYETPRQFSNMIMESDGNYLTALYFGDFETSLKHTDIEDVHSFPVFEETCRWLDCYFSGEKPDFMPKYKIKNLTPFRHQVIEIMKAIPYGETVTYKDIAEEIARRQGIKKMSAQAVGGAVGWNPLCILIPCHRVMGTGGKLTGYGGGIQNKIELLELEGVDTSGFLL